MSDDTAPCLGCGLCCDGTLFARVEVNDAEEEQLKSVGYELITVSDKTYLPQPCPHARCGQCTIYETRFETCRSFRCALLRRYQAGEVSGKDARAIVEKALELVAKVREGDPDIGSYEERHRTRFDLGSQLITQKTDMPEAGARRLLNILALDTFLERWFRIVKKREPQIAAAEKPEAEA